MYQSLLDKMIITVSIVLCGISIKLLDNFVDERKDYYVPYMMLILCISAVLWKKNAALFMSSYIVGMFHDEGLKLVSSLRAYQEQVIVFIINSIVCGLKVCVWSLLIICTIQLLDDLIDYKKDQYNYKKNWAIMFGRIEAAITATICFIISLYFNIPETIICTLTATIISVLSARQGGI